MLRWSRDGVPFRNPAGDIDVVAWTKCSLAETPAAIDLVGPVRVTLALPAALEGADVSAWGQPPGTGDAWVAGSWGEHSVTVGGQRDGWLRVLTWAETVWVHPDLMKLIWLATDAALSREWFDTMGTAPNGLDFAQLAADLASVGTAA